MTSKPGRGAHCTGTTRVLIALGRRDNDQGSVRVPPGSSTTASSGQDGRVPDSTTPPTTPRGFSTDELGSALSEILDHVDAAGWGQTPAVFALVPTEVLAEQAPDVLGDDADSPLTPIEQECPDLDAFLASAIWPDAVVGAAVAIEIVVAPPAPGGDGTPRYVADGTDSAASNSDGASKPARLVAGVLRGGQDLAIMRLRHQSGEEIETLTHPQLGTELRVALAGTFTPDEPGA